MSVSVPPAAAVSASGSGNTTLAAGPYSFEVDTTAPTLTAVAIASDNANTGLAKAGDVITVSITADENISEPTVTIAGNAASVSGSGTSYTATYTVQVGDTGAVAINISGYSDAAGNAGATVTTATAGSVTMDTTAPTIASIDPADEATITSLDEIVVTFTEEVVNLTAGQLTVNGSPADTVTGTNPYTFSGFDTPDLGTVNVALAADSTTDLAGNAFAGGSWSYEKEPISLTITSTLAEDSVSETQTQTLTFTFGDNVSGFDADQVSVTNATKGAFSGSGAIYTLELTGEGGLIEVEVPANFGPQFTESATFSNFYQDTWTIELQESPLVTMDLIRIPAGTFMMGSPETELSRNSNETQHQVTISQDFYLGKTQVTQEQWLAIQGSWPGTAPSATFGVGDNFPAYFVSHNDIQTFLANLSTTITEPGTFALPTESQWEYAARAGTTTRFNFGDGLSTDDNCTTGGGREDNMWYCGNSPSGTKLVGQFPANAWGLHDMHGNVWEWCADWFGTYPAGPVTDPTGPATGLDRVIRGGSWANDARDCRSGQRIHFPPAFRTATFGFRVLAVRPPAALTITSSETESVHQTETQTLTFSFGADVTGFDASDINMTGATAGTFTQISPSEYTLEITGDGGTITVDVAAGAAEAPAPFQGTAAATFSNFYQDTWTIELQESPQVTMDLIRIPAGTFTMGSPEDELSRTSSETQHEVTISQDFYLGKTQVTQAQWLAIEGSWPGTAPSATRGVGDNFPAYFVSHNDIQTFLANLNTTITEPGTFALPTEAQWEYACRAGTTTRFNFGDGFASNETSDIGGGRGDNMWFTGNSGSSSQIVGQFPANAWGLHDMHGNVREWCADWSGTYPTGPVTDPTGPATGSFRVVRGGSWFEAAAGSTSP